MEYEQNVFKKNIWYGTMYIFYVSTYLSLYQVPANVDVHVDVRPTV